MGSRVVMLNKAKRKSNTPLVSIVMSVYNPVPHFFRLAVASLKKQTLTDWELIICDDYSHEKCSEFILKLAATDPRIRVVKNRINSGLAVSLNKCIALSRGDYIARMDDDDICMPERLEKQVKFLEEHFSVSWVGCNAGLMDDTGRWGERKMPECPEARDFLRFCPYIHPSVMFRRSVFEKYGGYKKLRRGEDYELFMRLHAAGLRGYNMQEELFLYREDARVSRRRGYYYQIEEAGIRLRGFRDMDVLSLTNMMYVIKPMLTGLISYRQRVKIKRMLGR